MEKSEVRIRRRILRGLSTHRRQRASRRGFSLGERGLRKSSLPSPSLVSWNHSVFLVHFVSLSLSFPPLCLFYSLERVSRSDMALPIGADTPRGVEADSTRVESFVRPSAGHPPPCCVHSAASSLVPVIPLQLLPWWGSVIVTVVRVHFLLVISPVYIVFSHLTNIAFGLDCNRYHIP